MKSSAVIGMYLLIDTILFIFFINKKITPAAVMIHKGNPELSMSCINGIQGQGIYASD